MPVIKLHGGAKIHIEGDHRTNEYLAKPPHKWFKWVCNPK